MLSGHHYITMPWNSCRHIYARVDAACVGCFDYLNRSKITVWTPIYMSAFGVYCVALEELKQYDEET